MIEPKQIVKSRRKTIALVIDSDGELIVRAPFYATTQEILQFVAQKQEWIKEKSRQIKQRNDTGQQYAMEEGARILYLGQEYVIRKKAVTRVKLTEEGMLLVPMNREVREALELWYKKRAALYLKPRTLELAQTMGVVPNAIRISSARSRWGSCSAQDHLNFSWYLMLCPPQVVDYVILHELSHILHKDHSRAFWNCVETFDAAYREHRQWLRDNQWIMQITQIK